jgi:hypothetical protein
MAFRIKPVEQTFSLDKTDKEYGNEIGSTIVRVRQASQSSVEAIDDLNALIQRKYEDKNPGEVVVSQKWSYQALRRVQAFHTLSECNIEDENGKILFPESVLKDQDKFQNAWGKLPPIVVDEIMEKIYIVNVSWGPAGNLL